MPTHWVRSAKLIVASLAFAALAACATPFNAQVSRFQTDLPAPEGQTFAIVTNNPNLQGGLEFSIYAKDVAAHLEKLGYARAASPQAASLLVNFDYGVDNGRQYVERDPLAPNPYFDPWYGYSRYYYSPRYWGSPWAYGFYDPFFDNDLNSYTVYTSKIDLKINRASDGQPLFEGRAQALSTSNHLQYLVPNLVEAMFTGFPGDNGKTVRISIAPEKMAAKRPD
nr:DUF4136 domain-containing protein [Tsuneonella mangrovi]